MKELIVEPTSDFSLAFNEAAAEPVRLKTFHGSFILATEEDFEFHSEVKLLSENEQLHKILDESRQSKKLYSLEELTASLENES